MIDPRDIGENLPELERQVFMAVRQGTFLSVGEVTDRLTAAGRPLAYTTVMTVLTRLWRKGYLGRQPEGRSYLYEALHDDDIRRDLGGREASAAIAKFGTPALSGFVRTLSPAQRELVATLLREHDDSDSELSS